MKTLEHKDRPRTTFETIKELTQGSLLYGESFITAIAKLTEIKQERKNCNTAHQSIRAKSSKQKVTAKQQNCKKFGCLLLGQ